MNSIYTEHHKCFQYLNSLKEAEIFQILSKLYRKQTKSTVSDKNIQVYKYYEDYYNGIYCDKITLSGLYRHTERLEFNCYYNNKEIAYYRLYYYFKENVCDLDVSLLNTAIRQHKISKIK
jgi:hypothetical protein